MALDPDSVTIYQMELPFNTTISGDRLHGTGQFQETVAPWATKRRWVDEAFAALERAGYTVGSAYTAVKHPGRTSFVYRDRLWQGADLAGLGVASFGHVNGVHMQNLDSWGAYARAIQEGRIPLNRAYRPTDEERLIRELVLQLKLGSIRPAYFRDKYGVDVRERFTRPVCIPRLRRLPGRVVTGTGPAVARGACCASTACCRASSCPHTPTSGTRRCRCSRSMPASDSSWTGISRPSMRPLVLTWLRSLVRSCPGSITACGKQ